MSLHQGRRMNAANAKRKLERKFELLRMFEEMKNEKAKNKNQRYGNRI
jgi:hypothetical protein